jgi:hypothetical protein
LTKSIVNDIGPLAFYSGPNTEPQFVHIDSALSGSYSVTGVGTGNGPYTITLTRRNAQGDIMAMQTVQGLASMAMVIPPIILDVPIDPLPDDLNGDGDVNLDDLNILLRDRGKTVSKSACGARCDFDGDGMITALDARIFQQLCTRPRCATQ